MLISRLHRGLEPQHRLDTSHAVCFHLAMPSANPCANTPIDDFHWRSADWWNWLTQHRRKPTAESILKYLDARTAFIVYHGCRPTDLSSYYKHGLRPTNLDQLDHTAEKIFLAAGLPVTLTEAEFESTMRSTSRIDQGKLYVALDDEHLVCSCGVYMIYGSEHLCGIAAKLMRAHRYDFRQILKRFGTPTVFRMRIPRDMVPTHQIEQLAEFVHSVIWESRRQRRVPQIDWSFTFSTEIPPQYILDHTHPASIPDPLFNGRLYHYDESEKQAHDHV